MAEKIREAKRAAAYQAVDDWVKDGMVVGIGSGSTVVFVVEKIVADVRDGRYKDLVCVPTSFQSKQLIEQGGLRLGSLESHPDLDVAIDGADECDAALNCIKGGGGCHALEKLVAWRAKTFVIVADHTKQSQRLGQRWQKGIPIEVLPAAHVCVSRALSKLELVPTLRMAQAKAGPVVTDSGNFIIDAQFPEHLGAPDALHTLAQSISAMPGVLDHGLFLGMARKAYFGQADGTVV
eukprot:CAMPEP_0119141886 /NCGR_PEP_ID=MMETSP1310-20130426/31742_1 /TAXON_ID=464262 /ORGANISM="Genus nov. species nov., Strain RCC2339" /LENGTH=235 /DNA_ID=CAMNT_0007133377 /DNA_START=32 /DNA_END=735 /DNA_ORIENTATION=-